ncbi:hypothetical protein N7520_006412 [Penicillium odoratum]|uniref:uncharacterized protein n=1 Tax=Penicillium odoratum TaxID=1167516 RepID=UPI002547B65A|nr:uncharacterized protein N7520_006412 [Penicillium odoratum]KAJ5759256.1 hypothetical protein N7520_006412 [Penicillium odoratum]
MVSSNSSVRLVMAFVALLALVSARPAAVSVPRVSRGLPETPSDDPFYQPPAGFESENPGTILRQRTVSVAFLGLIPDPVEAYQLLYRTTAINGSAIATVTTIFKPTNPKTDRFVSFHTAYDSSDTICDPSYNYRLGAAQTDIISSAEQLILQAYLLLGYIVASPDYEGPDAAFGPGRLAGMGVLDNMRAVSNFDALGLSTSTPMIVGTGYSGGAIATGWAASLQPTYAPELDIKGWAQGGTPANLTGTLMFIDDTLFSGFLPPAVAGLSAPSAYGAELVPVLDEILTSEGRSVVEKAQNTCAVGDLLNFADMSLLSTSVQSLGDRLLYESTIQAIMKQCSMGVARDETPTAPVFVYHASQDEIIPYANASTMVDSWCNYGADVKFTTFGNGGHATTEVIGLPDTINFVESAFAGTTQSGCSSNTELTSILNPIALGVELEPVLVKLLEVLATLGTSDSNLKQDLDVLNDVVKW